MSRGGTGLGGDGEDLVFADGKATIDGGAGDDVLTFHRTVLFDANGAIDALAPGAAEHIDITATGGAGSDIFLLSNEMAVPLSYSIGGDTLAAGSAAEADFLATAFPESDDIGAVTDYDPAEDFIVVEAPAAASGFVVGDISASAAPTGTATLLKITYANEADPTQPDLVRTLRLEGIATFDPASVIVINAGADAPAVI
jgi:hypothetical protein